jgi:biotin carboxylase
VKRLLLLGGSHAEVPLVESARVHGCLVATLGLDADGLAARCSDEHHIADFSDVAQVQKVFIEGDFDILIAGCNDFAAFTVAEIAENVGLVKYDSVFQTQEIHLKNRFRLLCEDLAVPVPRSTIINKDDPNVDALESFAFPVLVKPIDLTGGKGMTRCESLSEVSSAIRLAFSISRQRQTVVEELITGNLRSACFFVYDQMPLLLIHADEYMYVNPFLVASALVPSGATMEQLDAVTEYARAVSSELGLCDGILHVQYLATENSVYVIEMCRRPPGDLYVSLPTMQGVSISDRIVCNALGSPVTDKVENSHLRNTLRICLMLKKAAKMSSWSVSPDLNILTDRIVALREQVTEIVNPLQEKLGIVIASADNRPDLEKFAMFASAAFTYKNLDKSEV